MNIDGISRVWRSLLKKKPAVPKPSAVDSEGVMSGSEHETRERNDYTEEKKAEAETHFLYGADGQKKPIDDGDHHDKLDEIG
tara:strand:+ start:749 stop:994 length:246 start_codon:yes stop_codon:yes gene_type:complete